MGDGSASARPAGGGAYRQDAGTAHRALHDRTDALAPPRPPPPSAAERLRSNREAGRSSGAEAWAESVKFALPRSILIRILCVFVCRKKLSSEALIQKLF